VLHYAEVSDIERTGYSAVPVTTPRRTLQDCIEANVSPDLVRQAVLQARRRGLISEKEGAAATDELIWRTLMEVTEAASSFLTPCSGTPQKAGSGYRRIGVGGHGPRRGEY
jgi:hypothetical protein